MPAVHDRGGLPTDSPIDRAEHEWADWEHVTNALVGVLRRRGLINVDELRRGIETMAPAEYLFSNSGSSAPDGGGRASTIAPRRA